MCVWVGGWGAFVCGSGCVHMHLCWSLSLCVNQNECLGVGEGGICIYIINAFLLSLAKHACISLFSCKKH